MELAIEPAVEVELEISLPPHDPVPGIRNVGYYEFIGPAEKVCMLEDAMRETLGANPHKRRQLKAAFKHHLHDVASTVAHGKAMVGDLAEASHIMGNARSFGTHLARSVGSALHRQRSGDSAHDTPRGSAAAEEEEEEETQAVPTSPSQIAPATAHQPSTPEKHAAAGQRPRLPPVRPPPARLPPGLKLPPGAYRPPPGLGPPPGLTLPPGLRTAAASDAPHARPRGVAAASTGKPFAHRAPPDGQPRYCLSLP